MKRSQSNDNKVIRCAIYTRKSSEEGLELEFNSLDAQRESAEAFIASQKAEGWIALPEQYNDGGFSGGTMERPGLDRLLRDIKTGGIDCVVVYKVDRLSRSLMDFSRIMDTFDHHGVSFVSVTQQFNTTHSMGRLTLNILLSFAQFEREIIGERIRDKIAAQKRRGKWAGGVPVLGYDVDRTTSSGSPHLVINATEAAQVREIFQMYLKKGSLLPVVEELEDRGWRNKQRITKKGKTMGGRPFDKSTLHSLLTNPLLIGKIRHKDEIYEGEHEAIIDEATFAQVEAQLKENGRTGGAEVRNKYGSLLRGLLRCKTCGAAMSHTFSGNGKRKGRHYRYYRCTRAIKSGRSACSVGTLPAAEVERVVIEEVRGLAGDGDLLREVLAAGQETIQAELNRLKQERSDLIAEQKRHDRELRQLAVAKTTTPASTQRLAELNELIDIARPRLAALEAQIAEHEAEIISEAEAEMAFRDFDRLWSTMVPREQARLLKLLIDSVEYDGKQGTISVSFRPTSIRSLIHRKMENAA